MFTESKEEKKSDKGYVGNNLSTLTRSIGSGSSNNTNSSSSDGNISSSSSISISSISTYPLEVKQHKEIKAQNKGSMSAIVDRAEENEKEIKIKLPPLCPQSWMAFLRDQEKKISEIQVNRERKKVYITPASGEVILTIDGNTCRLEKSSVCGRETFYKVLSPPAIDWTVVRNPLVVDNFVNVGRIGFCAIEIGKLIIKLDDAVYKQANGIFTVGYSNRVVFDEKDDKLIPKTVALDSSCAVN